MIKNLYLPGFSHRLCGRRRGAQAKAVRAGCDRLNGLAALLSKFIPAAVFDLDQGQRERIYPPWVTFIAFLGQVLTRASTCREAVRKVQAWLLRAQLAS